jgi:hypothetical protein
MFSTFLGLGGGGGASSEESFFLGTAIGPTSPPGPPAAAGVLSEGFWPDGVGESVEELAWANALPASQPKLRRDARTSVAAERTTDEKLRYLRCFAEYIKEPRGPDYV